MKLSDVTACKDMLLGDNQSNVEEIRSLQAKVRETEKELQVTMEMVSFFKPKNVKRCEGSKVKQINQLQNTVNEKVKEVEQICITVYEKESENTKLQQAIQELEMKLQSERELKLKAQKEASK